MFIDRPKRRIPAKVSASWARLERWVKKHFPPQLRRLNPGASEAEIVKLEKSLKQNLPDDVRESWRIHNGQGQCDEGLIFQCHLSTLVGIEEDWRMALEAIAYEEAHPERVFLDGVSSTPPGAILHEEVTKGWIPIHRRDREHIGIDLNPGATGESGQVITYRCDIKDYYVLAQSWAHFLEDVADELEAGNFVLDFDKKGIIETFHVGLRDSVNGPFYQHYAEWSAAKLPENFGPAIEGNADKSHRSSGLDFSGGVTYAEPPASPREWAGAAKCLQGFLNAMHQWENQLNSRRPIASLELIRIEETRGVLQKVEFDRKKARVVSCSPEYVFDTMQKVGGAQALMLSDDQQKMMEELNANSSCGGGNAIEFLQEYCDKLDEMLSYLDAHPLAKMYRDPIRSAAFFRNGEFYDKAMRTKREIVAQFAPEIDVPELLVQCDPPSYAANMNRIDDVTIKCPDQYYVYLKPTQVFLLDIHPIDWDEREPVNRIMRYVVIEDQKNWLIKNREVSYDGADFRTLSF